MSNTCRSVILVDMSGTIANSRDALSKLFERFNYVRFKALGFKGSMDELREIFREVNAELRRKRHEKGDLIMGVAKRAGIKISKEKAKEWEEMFAKLYIQEVEPIKGAIWGIRELTKIDKVTLVTNSKEEMVIPVLEKFGIKNLFSEIICLGGTGRDKSTGRIFEEMRRKGAWLIIGDSYRKDRIAEKYGIKFLNVKMGWGKLVKIVRNLKDKNKNRSGSYIANREGRFRKGRRRGKTANRKEKRDKGEGK